MMMKVGIQRRFCGWWCAIWVVVGLLWVQSNTGCVPNGQIDTSKLSTTCEKNDDCVTVLVGDLCACSCNYLAINKSGQASYDIANKAAKDSCGTFGKTCGPCATIPPEKVKCINKACIIEK